MQQQRTFHRTNNTVLPADVPDFKSVLLNTILADADILKDDKYRPDMPAGRYIGRPLTILKPALEYLYSFVIDLWVCHDL